MHLFSGNDDKATLIFTVGADQGFVRWWADEMYDSQGEEVPDQPYWQYLYNGSPAEIERSKLIPQEQVRTAAQEFLVTGEGGPEGCGGRRRLEAGEGLPWPGVRDPRLMSGVAGDTGRMVDDIARDRAIYQALKAADEVAAALQAHLIEEHGADPDRTVAQNPSTNSFKLLRQARERLGQGLRAVEADSIAESDGISLRNP
jgi:immunity protein Imm1 of predicted polymorphic toxin system